MPAAPTTLPEALMATAVASVLGTGFEFTAVGTTPRSVIVYFCCALAGFVRDATKIAISKRTQRWRNQVLAVVAAGAPLPVIMGLPSSLIRAEIRGKNGNPRLSFIFVRW